MNTEITVRMEIRKSKNGEWFTRTKRKQNGKVLQSSETFKRKSTAIRNAEIIKGDAQHIEIVLVDGAK